MACSSSLNLWINSTDVYCIREHVTAWDMAETRSGGPYSEILHHDIFINCIYLSQVRVILIQALISSCGI